MSPFLQRLPLLPFFFMFYFSHISTTYLFFFLVPSVLFSTSSTFSFLLVHYLLLFNVFLFFLSSSCSIFLTSPSIILPSHCFTPLTSFPFPPLLHVLVPFSSPSIIFYSSFSLSTSTSSLLLSMFHFSSTTISSPSSPCSVPLIYPRLILRSQYFTSLSSFPHPSLFYVLNCFVSSPPPLPPHLFLVHVLLPSSFLFSRPRFLLYMLCFPHISASYSQF